ncbi:hypothetical protein [Halodesulfovibrio marinisediminis]|uniref:Uncharacterized protein n=1 Tax=Halodesulfovibrio marinisediminis DSM 17456 TaxID=1121457 RepID=A0A1N6DQI8_9BACT|nr:hypothetical protein [Halodesulfovibrio marinisediminis]SIN73065.1 hypothetical protein SAMN02745161_0396 [Halodesulfovibrio marinisediminis DSM 17456]
MADAATFSWSALAVPVVSGAFTVLATAVIVFGANWLTRRSIEASNAKALADMKGLLEQNKEIEDKKISASAHQEWLKELTDTLVMFCVYCEKLSALAIHKKSQLQDPDGFYKVLDDAMCPILSDLSSCVHKLNCLLNMSDPEQKALYKKLREIQSNAMDVVSDTVAKKKIDKVPNVDKEAHEMINKLITGLRRKLFVLPEPIGLKEPVEERTDNAA